MIIHQEKVRITPSAGDGSDNTLSVMGLCYQIVVKPVTAGTDNIYNRGDQGRTSIRVICDYI